MILELLKNKNHITRQKEESSNQLPGVLFGDLYVMVT